MDFAGNIHLLNNGLVKNLAVQVDNDFPINPVAGSFCFRNQILYICVDISSLPVWIPLTKPLEMKRYVQVTTALEWTITHNLNISPVFVQVFDSTGQWILPDYIDCSNINNVLIGFNTPVAGTAIIMRGEVDGGAQPTISYEQSYTNQATWVVNHNLGYNPIINCFVGGQQVQPSNITYNTTMLATVSFSSARTGYVRCI